MALALAAVRHAFSQGRCCELLIARNAGHVGLYCRAPSGVTRLVQEQFLAANGDLRIEAVPDGAFAQKRGHRCYWKRLQIATISAALVSHDDLVDREQRLFIDPMSAILMAVATKKSEWLQPFVSIVARRAGALMVAFACESNE